MCDYSNYLAANCPAALVLMLLLFLVPLLVHPRHDECQPGIDAPPPRIIERSKDANT